ncbi:PEP-CTERM sorting domain-containing protein [Sphingomonas sp. MMS24-J13]|uniref:PEP-CTERM sorting domain-containing protein n=1 Tax=Sphingomonas sp. MMS24-J13 TaxID=3238686 RepID=UPI003851199C
MHLYRSALLAALALLASPASAKTILFVGNSFTFGGGSAVRIYHPDYVTDLNDEHIGGVPALFATFAREAGLDWQVSLETSPGRDLAFHYADKQRELAGKWDVVMLQGFSTLDPARPGDPTRHIQAAAELAAMFRAQNPQVRVELVSTWSRADLTFRPGGHWYGKPITRMAQDIDAANALAVRRNPDIVGTVPVGLAWNRAIQAGLADDNPYDGIAFGKIDLWTWDQYHASVEGYYLSALMIFGRVTGLDPRTLGETELAGNALGIAPVWIKALQNIAAEELSATRPGSGNEKGR